MLDIRRYPRLAGMVKFLMSLAPDIEEELRKIAKDRGVTLQALIRHIVGEWLAEREISL